MSISATETRHALRVTETVPPAVALAFLKGDPRENVFLILRIQRSGMTDTRDPAHGRFLGAFDRAQSLRGLCFIGNTGTLILSVDEPWVAREFVEPVLEAGYRFTIAISEFDAGREFLTRFKKRSGRKPTLDRKQAFYALDESTLVRKGIKELDMDQASLDSTDGRAYLCRDTDGTPTFKCDLAVVGSEGALLEGVYTPREYRSKNIATRALWTLCKDLLRGDDSAPFVVLHVDDRNKAARKAYENVGFQEIATYRLTLLPTAS